MYAFPFVFTFQQRFQIDAFSVSTLSVFERISVDGRPKRIEIHAFSNENALVWTGPQIDESFCTCYRRRFLKYKKMHIKCLTSAFKEIFHPVRLPLCGAKSCG